MAASEQVTSVAQSDVSFSVGESFSSFIEFEKKLKDYERHNAVQLSRRDSSILEAAAKRVPKRLAGAPSELRYYEVQYTCFFSVAKSIKEKFFQNFFKCLGWSQFCMTNDNAKLTPPNKFLQRLWPRPPFRRLLQPVFEWETNSC